MSGYLELDALAEHAVTPSKAALDITGDIELVGLIALDTYPPVDSNAWFISRFAGGARSYALGYTTDGALQLAWNDGSSTNFLNNNGSLPALSGGDHVWLKATLDVDDGTGSFEANYYYSLDPIDTPEGSVSWTATGDPKSNTATSINSTATDLFTGNFDDDFDNGELIGKVYLLKVRDGIGGTEVANPDWRTDDQGWSSGSGTDDAGNVWTLGNGATWVPPASEERHVGRHVHFDFANKQVVIESGV